jgi:DNA-binding winged helix-turn-helix (wHTH) protein
MDMAHDPGLRRFAGYVLDPARCALRRPDGVEAVLRPKTYAVLERLLLARGAVLSRRALLDEVWDGLAVTDDSLTQCVGEIRRALGPDAAWLRTLPRRGYLLDVPADASAPAVAPPPPSGNAPGMVQDLPAAPPARRRPWLAWTLAGFAASAAAVALVTRGPAPSPPPPTLVADPAVQRRAEAERLVEEGRLLVTGAVTSERTFQARERFLAAIAIDPGFGPAHSRAALTYPTA